MIEAQQEASDRSLVPLEAQLGALIQSTLVPANGHAEIHAAAQLGSHTQVLQQAQAS